MAKFTVFLLTCSFVVALTLARPQRDSLLDKATVQDVAANSVAFDKRQSGENNGVATVRVIPGEDPSKDKRQPSRPPAAAAAMFSRIIDDIFQIPITVLQSVARMLSGPIGSQSKKGSDASSH